MDKMKVGILGLGLIGGSLAKALKAKAGITNIVAFERRQEFIDRAVNEGVIKEGYNVDFSVFRGCELVFICSPVETVAKFAKDISQFTSGIITDVGSTKNEIMAETEALNFIGGHPMTGSEKTSYLASDEKLFENAVYVLCKGKNCTQKDFDLLKQIVTLIGAIAIEMKPDEHDKSIGIISHLPHIVAAGLVNMAKDNDHGGLNRLAAGGFKDITRISSSKPELWQQIISSSGSAISNILNEFILKLLEIKKSIDHEENGEILTYFENAKEYRDKLTENVRGLLPSQFEVWVEVSDKPGIIGNVATLLGENGINIKNMNIQNNREYEGGCLRLSIDSYIEAENAVKILNENGYSCNKKI
jgi:prephenate dehydrogenase